MDFAGRFASRASSKDSLLLFDTLLRVSQTLRLRMNDWLVRFELNDGRYAVLTSLAGSQERGCSQAELAAQLGQSESNISSLIERMQRDGLVHRLRSETDRRKRVLRISPAGRQLLKQVESSQASWTSQALRGFPASHQTALVSLLKQLGHALQTASEVSAVPTLKIAWNDESPEVTNGHQDFIDDPKSPRFALQQLLLALSVHAGPDSLEKEVA